MFELESLLTHTILDYTNRQPEDVRTLTPVEIFKPT